MTTPNHQHMETGLPFGGLNQLPDARMIRDNELAQMDNAILRDGRVAPRPGYKPATTAGSRLVFSRRVVVSGDSDVDFGVHNIVRGLAISATKIYFVISKAGGDEIWYCDHNGENLGDWGDDGAVVNYGLAIDTTDDNLYVVDTTNDKVRKYDDLDLSGGGGWSDEETAFTSPIDLKWDGTYLYCSDGADDTIERWTPGNARSTILTNSCVETAQFDVYGDYIYIADKSANKIVKCDKDTADQTTVTDVLTDCDINVGLCIDSTNEKIIYARDDKYIARCDLDGSNNEVMCYAGDVVGMAYNSTNKRVYWLDEDTNRVYSCRADDTYSEVVSTFTWRRGVLDVDPSSSEYSKDMVLGQVIDTNDETSDLVVWTPHNDETYLLACGYVAPTGDEPGMLVTNDRDSDPTIGASISSNSGRMSFTPTGTGINTGKGGVVICDGDEDSDSPYMFNYVLGNTKWTLVDSSGLAGSFTMTFNGETTATVANNASATTVMQALNGLASIDACHVTSSGGAAGANSYVIWVLGAWAGKDTPALTVTDSVVGTTNFAVTRTQTGGTETGSMFYLMPLGLPRPTTGENNVNVDVTTDEAGALAGVYNWCATWYSSLFDLESPPSAFFIDYRVSTTHDYMRVDNLDAGPPAGDTIRRRIDGYPSTLWFNSAATQDFPVVDKIRFYRRRWGGTGSGVHQPEAGISSPNGVGATYTWEFEDEFDAPMVKGTGAIDGTGAPYGDTVIAGADPYPYENEYPPLNAQFCAIVRDRAYYASMAPSDHNVWVSEQTKRGGIQNGEYGFGYVSNDAYYDVASYVADDAPFTSLFPFGELVMVGTPNGVMRLQPTENLFGAFSLVVEKLRGVSGVGSHWLMCEARRMPDAPGLMFWVSPEGHVFSFDGSSTRLVSQRVDTTSDELTRKYWHKYDYFDAGFNDSLYWGSLVYDPGRNMLIMYAPASDGTARNLFLSLDTDPSSGLAPGWGEGDIDGRGWLVIREWRSTGGLVSQGHPIVVFGSGGQMMALVDGWTDNGTSFTTTVKTKRFTLGAPTMWKRWSDVVFYLHRRSFSGSDAEVTIAAILDGITSQTTGTITLTTDATRAVDVPVAALDSVGEGRDLQVQITSVQDENDKDHPEIVSMSVGAHVTGRSRRGALK